MQHFNPFYRRRMQVCETVQHGGYTYPVCPRCRLGLEREYQAFCDRCGQRLGWDRFPEAEGLVVEDRT